MLIVELRALWKERSLSCTQGVQDVQGAHTVQRSLRWTVYKSCKENSLSWAVCSVEHLKSVQGVQRSLSWAWLASGHVHNCTQLMLIVHCTQGVQRKKSKLGSVQSEQ